MMNWVFNKGDKVHCNTVMDKDKPFREQQMVVYTVESSTTNLTSFAGVEGEWPTKYLDLLTTDGLHYDPLFWIEAKIDDLTTNSDLLNDNIPKEQKKEREAIKKYLTACLYVCWGIEVSVSAPLDSTSKPSTIFTKVP